MTQPYQMSHLVGIAKLYQMTQKFQMAQPYQISKAV